MKMKRIGLTFFIFILHGCAMNPQEIKSANVTRLCEQYSAPLSPQFMSPEIREELIRRGAVHCTTPEYVQARAAALHGLSGASMNLLQAGQRRTYTQPPPVLNLPQTVRCTSRINPLTNQVETTCN